MKEKFDVVLDASSPTFVADFKRALGLKDGESVQIVTPQFTRTDGMKIGYFPKTEAEYDAIKFFSDDELKAIGCQRWDERLWLYPHEWYEHIPAGYEITNICGEVEQFILGKTDDDIRFGALAFGFVRATN